MLDPGTILGPFRIEKELGSGAMGTVFKCTYTETGQVVAIKIIALGLIGNDTAMDRFEREYKILRQLDHPNIVKLYATGRYKKTPFFAMEYIQGESLDRILNRRTRLSWIEVVELGKQLCAALQHAHEKGIIHRDLKPSNLMILRDGTLKLTDFGIAKDTDATSLTNANSTVGTAAYMSPEQCKGERNLTAKSDLYSLGVVLYELLTGEKPFKKDTPVDMFMAHVSEPFERPSRRVLEIPPWLDTLVCQLMEKKPEHRPYDAAMVAKVLNEVETKMMDHHSAGLDAAATRFADRTQTATHNGDDKDAARLIRSGLKRKKLKTKRRPFYQKNWFMAISLPLALFAMGWLVWQLMRPPTPDEYYRRVEAARKVNNAAQAHEILREFAATYPNASDPNADRMREWLEEAEAEKLDRQMQNRARRGLSEDSDGETIVRSALNHENEGRVKAAIDAWQELYLLFISAEAVEDKGWGWLAKRKIKYLNQLPDRVDKLATLTSLPDSPTERMAMEAARFEKLEDIAAARERWAELKSQYKDFESRNYVVLAAARFAELKDKPPLQSDEILAARRSLLEKKLLELNELLKEGGPKSLEKAGALVANMAYLYRDESDDAVKKSVAQAEKALKEHVQKE